MSTETCSRSYEDSECGGDLFERVSRSGCTDSTICERHAEILDDALDAIERRYPEVNHSDGCGCWGCSEGSY
jgi:hypothetical protein